ncbi:MAG: FtsB family cell division protein, partial [Gaiellaceae bacterium]
VSSKGKRTKFRRATRARRRRSSVRRLVLLGLVVLIALLYAGPLRSYYDKRELVRSEHARVAQLRSQHDALEQKLKNAKKAEAVERAARKLFYVKPGERLYIVTGIDGWRRNQAHSGR